MQLKDKNIVVVGLGRTGLATARFLHQKSARVLVADTADETQLGESVRTLREMGVALELGPHRITSFQNADLIVVSPGVSHTIEPIEQAKSRGIPLMSEVELASRFIKEPIEVPVCLGCRRACPRPPIELIRQSWARPLA